MEWGGRMAHSSLGRSRGDGSTALVEDAEALLECGVRAQQVNGDLLAGRSWFEAAYREGERSGDADVMARAVLGLGGLRVHEHRGAAGSGLLQARLRHVQALVDPTSALALRLRARSAAETDYGAGRYETILAVLDEARAVAEPAVRFEALSLAHHCLLGPGAQRSAPDAGQRAGRRGGPRGPPYRSVDGVALAGDRPGPRRRS